MSPQKVHITKSEEAAIDIEEELARVLDFQEQERIEMQNKVKSFALHFKVWENLTRNVKSETFT